MRDKQNQNKKIDDKKSKIKKQNLLTKNISISCQTFIVFNFSKACFWSLSRQNFAKKEKSVPTGNPFPSDIDGHFYECSRFLLHTFFTSCKFGILRILCAWLQIKILLQIQLTTWDKNKIAGAQLRFILK